MPRADISDNSHGSSPLHLRSVALTQPPEEGDRAFPFSVPAIRSLPTLRFAAPVTFFVGENGSGKSTLLEAIAAAAGLPTVGSASAATDPTLAAQRGLADRLTLTWSQRTRRGFFLRAEDFFGFTKRLAQERSEMLERIHDLEMEYRGRSAYAKSLAQLPMRASVGEMDRRYGPDLDANSHGQSFLTLFRSRFVPGGLYLLDEPEAPLSPQSQLGLIRMLSEMVGREAQFLIATHSPILLAFPGASIWSFDQLPVAPVAYDDLEHVSLTREFLANPGRFLRHLISESEDAAEE